MTVDLKVFHNNEILCRDSLKTIFRNKSARCLEKDKFRIKVIDTYFVPFFFFLQNFLDLLKAHSKKLRIVSNEAAMQIWRDQVILYSKDSDNKRPKKVRKENYSIYRALQRDDIPAVKHRASSRDIISLEYWNRRQIILELNKKCSLQFCIHLKYLIHENNTQKVFPIVMIKSRCKYLCGKW